MTKRNETPSKEKTSDSNPSIAELAVVFGTGLVVTVLAGIVFQLRGYPRVVTASATLDVLAPPIYMIPVFFPYGILLGEVIWIWREKGDQKLATVLFIECVVIGAISFLRYVTGIPFSGHMVILAFFLLHEAVTSKLQHPIRLIIGTVVLLLTTVFKIVIWKDPLTYILGMMLGILLWFPGQVIRQNHDDRLEFVEL
ncbi:MAG: hypothetical protein ACFFD4_05645 [Candidatus Odinarchaeota archaeon]